ncbi:hypothetical protein [Thermostilla marina]
MATGAVALEDAWGVMIVGALLWGLGSGAAEPGGSGRGESPDLVSDNGRNAEAGRRPNDPEGAGCSRVTEVVGAGDRRSTARQPWAPSERESGVVGVSCGVGSSKGGLTAPGDGSNKSGPGSSAFPEGGGRIATTIIIVANRKLADNPSERRKFDRFGTGLVDPVIGTLFRRSCACLIMIILIAVKPRPSM